MEQYRIVLGIEIGRDFLRSAEVENRDGKFFLSRVAERKLETLEVEELVQVLSLLINEETILSRIASVAIDTTITERDTVEVDADLRPEEISGFLKAEISFHNNFSENEYRPAYEVVKTSREGYKEIFYAAINKPLLNSLRNACTRCGLDLQFIDLDHSCSETTINKLEQSVKNYVLVTVKSHQVEASFCKDGERNVYKYINYSGEPFYFVTKIVQDLESETNEYAEKIFVAGTTADVFLVDLLQKSVDKRYELLVPTQSLLLSPVASTNNKLKTVPHHFSPAIGAALK
ncbi:MAG: hypothetical protein M1470_11720 [Bacteroidetes bacterium]|nr:hypothetical protein [Bacteroidota bacterium]MCL5737657.1 hypothetical protein [Bacteroidota bacterium]